MVVLTHGPETCAAVHAAVGDLARAGFTRLATAGTEYGITLHGAWINPIGHASYIVLDAPNLHAVSTLMIDLKLFHWNTVQIEPVITVEEALTVWARSASA